MFGLEVRRVTIAKQNRKTKEKTLLSRYFVVDKANRAILIDETKKEGYENIGEAYDGYAQIVGLLMTSQQNNPENPEDEDFNDDPFDGDDEGDRR